MEGRCFVCRKSFATLSLEARQRHINACLDQQREGRGDSEDEKAFASVRAPPKQVKVDVYGS
eukprot:1338089-Amorphochlora_amoeboformis.AAC.1